MIQHFEQDCREIASLKAQYFRFMDTKDYVGLDRLFAPDAVIDVRGSGGAADAGAVETLDGDAGLMDGIAFCQFLRVTLPPLVTVHHGHMPEFTALPDGRIAAIWAMEDRILFPADSRIRTLHGWGHYHDVYVRGDDGAWIIAAMTLTRLRVDTV
ncbi:MAG: nuclear transport factor 2 family protein [Sphingobium sp.]|nr:nuclear transport factor 2 family protein [Sphingobium sp.]